MYGTSDESGATAPPRCPACQGRTYYVDPEQTVITCYDCGRYFRRKKPEAEAAAAPKAPVAPEAPKTPPPRAKPEPQAPPAPKVPEPPVYVPPPPPPVREPEPPAPPEEEEGFDLMVGMTGGEAGTKAAGEPTACSVCGFPMEAEWRVCPNCVSRYETECRGCGRVLSAWWLVCPWCETPKAESDMHFLRK